MGTSLDDHDEDNMDNRLGRLAGLAAFALMLLRLGRLIESGGDAPAWQLIMIASAFLGGVIWWLLSQTMSRRRTAVAIFAVAGLVLFLRIAVPHTLVAGFVPTGETLEVLGAEMSQAINIIRFGVAPIFPTSGVVAILAVLMWGTGGLYVWGASDGPTAAMVLPSLALYLQFAVMDRVLAGRGWMGAAAVVIAMAVAAIAMERRSDAGRVRDLDGRPLPRRATAMAFVLAVIVAIGAFVVTDRSAALVPPNGNIQWRVGSGYGAGIGGIAFDRLADLQQNVISRSNAIVFTATFGDGAPPADEVYWRMESLDVFDGGAWRPNITRAEFYSPETAGGDPQHVYRGTLESIAQNVRIDKLRMEVVPVAGIATHVQSTNLNTSVFQIGEGGTLIYQPQTREGDEYQAITRYANVRQDLGALATVNGELSPLFAGAAEDGLFPYSPGPTPGSLERPADIERFLELPDGLPAALSNVARSQTAGAVTDFERAWLLQW